MNGEETNERWQVRTAKKKKKKKGEDFNLGHPEYSTCFLD